MEAQINAANGTFLGVYTQSGAQAPIATAYNNIHSYFQGSYFTGKAPPISYAFTPYSAVIDMQTGEVLAMDTQTSYLSTSQIMAAVNQANSD